uniref:Altered inheritance of mitochondria protein 24, mitochondrial n=1 Tax=Heterosigma akashiwo TaxID=2829 RepID=A0A7S3UX59_HETAK
MNNQNQQEHHHRETGIDFSIFGSDVQVLQITLLQGDSVTSHISSYCYSSCDVNPYDLPSTASLFQTLFGALSGDPTSSMKKFLNDGTLPGCLTLSGRQNGKILPVHIEDGAIVLLHPCAFLCSTAGVALSAKAVPLPPGPRAAPLPLRPPLRWLAAAGRGLLFLHAGGIVLEKQLAGGEAIKVDVDHLIAISGTCTIESNSLQPTNARVQASTRLLHTCTVTGPGMVYFQSVSNRKLGKDLLHSAAAGRGQAGSGPGGPGGGAPPAASCLRFGLMIATVMMLTLAVSLMTLLLEEELMQ